MQETAPSDDDSTIELRRPLPTPSLRPSSHWCAARSCGTPIPFTEVMCEQHWPLVPSDIKDRIRAVSMTGHAVIDPPAEYSDAVRTAMAAVWEAARPGASR